MTIQVAQIIADVVELVFSPWEEELRVGEILSIVDRRQRRGLLVQILEIHSGPAMARPPERSRTRGDNTSLPFSPRRRGPKTSTPSVSVPPSQHVARAKIRQLTTPDWQAWDGWIPTRDAVVTHIPDRDILPQCLVQGEHPLTLGQTQTGERFVIESRALTGVNLITGAYRAEACHLASVIWQGLVAQGRPCMVFALNRPDEFALGFSSPAQEGQGRKPDIMQLWAGRDFKLDLRQCGAAALLTLLTHFGLPKLPALYFVSHVAQRLAQDAPARQASQTPPFLGVEELLQLASDLEAGGNKVLVGAILSCLWLIKQEGVLASTPAETTEFLKHYEAMRQGGGAIVDLSAVGHTVRGGIVRAVVDMLIGLHSAEKVEGEPRAPCLILEEPHLYLSRHELQDILMRLSSLEMTSFLVTTRLSGIDPVLLQHTENLFLLRHGCPDDIRALTDRGLLDQETASALSCRLGSHRGLLVGKSTGHFPVLFAIEAIQDRRGVSAPMVAHHRPSALPPLVPETTMLALSPPSHGGAGVDATLPLFPEDDLSPSTIARSVLPREPQHPSPPPSVVVSLTQIMAQWERVIKRVGRRRRILETILATARPVHLDGHTLFLGFPPQSRFQQELMASPEYRGLLEEELAGLFGVAFEVTATFYPLPAPPEP